MLGKLLKYDLKWGCKPLVVFYIIAIFFAIVSKIFQQFENSLIFFVIVQICSGVVISMAVNILINNFMRVWSRFIRNMYKDEAYLTHTLPVKKSTIYTSKILMTIITMLISVIVILISLAICYLTKDNIEFLIDSIEATAVFFNSSVSSFLITIAVTLFFELLFGVFAGIMGIILGYRSNNLKVVKSIVYGFVIYIITSMLSLVVMLIIGLFNPDIMNLFNTVNVVDINAIKSVLYIGIILYTAYIVAYYFIGKKLLNKGVDVD